MLKKLIGIFLVVFALFLAGVVAAYAQLDGPGKTVVLTATETARVKPMPPAETQKTCPVMPGESVKKKFHVDYEGHRIYFCCKPCIRSFKRDPEKYIRILKGG